MARETMQEVRESLRGVDVVRVRNALITHSFVASKHLAESEDNAGPDVGERGTGMRATLNPLARATARPKKDTVDPYLREVLQALMDLLLPTDICRLLTALDLANTSATVRRDTLQEGGAEAAAAAAAHGKTVSASDFVNAGSRILRRASSLPEMLEAGKKRQRREYFVALISNRTHSGVEEDALFVLRAHVSRPKGGVGPNGKIIRKTKSLKRFSWGKKQGKGAAAAASGGLGEVGVAPPRRTSVLRDAGSFVGDSIAKAPQSSVQLSIVKVFPIWSDLRISLKGRGLVRLSSAGDSMRVGTVSIRSMWRLVMSLMRARAIAKANNYFPQGPSHKWIEIYLQDLLPGATPPGLEHERGGRHEKKTVIHDEDGDQTEDGDDEEIDFEDDVELVKDTGRDLDDDDLGGLVGRRDLGSHELDGHLDHLAGQQQNRRDSDDDEDTDDATSVSVNTDLPAFASKLLAGADGGPLATATAGSVAGTSSSSKSNERLSQREPGDRLSQDSRAQAEEDITDEIRTIIQTTLNLDDLTTGEVIHRLEAKFGRKLMSHFKKSFIDEKIIEIYGQQEPPSRIVAGLYLGTEYNASDFTALQNTGVATIINVTKEIKDFFPGHFDYLRISVRDHETADLHAHFRSACEKIAQARAEGHTVFVHCQRGISRSATIVIAFLMQSRRLSYEDAYNIVKQNRPIIKPNRGFIKQLHRFEEELN